MLYRLSSAALRGLCFILAAIAMPFLLVAASFALFFEKYQEFPGFPRHHGLGSRGDPESKAAISSDGQNGDHPANSPPRDANKQKTSLATQPIR
jgi:hypothetical protein